MRKHILNVTRQVVARIRYRDVQSNRLITKQNGGRAGRSPLSTVAVLCWSVVVGRHASGVESRGLRRHRHRESARHSDLDARYRPLQLVSRRRLHTVDVL